MAPSTMLIANASRLTEIEVHSPNLINTDLSECKMLQRIDISDCTALGTGVGAQPILNVQKCKYLRYLDCRNTQLTSIYTMQSGSNLEEIYYPQSVQSIQLTNQAYLKTIGIPYEVDENGIVTKYCENLADVEINNCRNVDYTHYPYKEGDYVNLDSIKQIQNFTLITSLDKLTGISFRGFSKLKNLKLSSMHNIATLGFDDMLLSSDSPTLENITVSDCPLIDTVSFNLSSVGYKVEFVEGAYIDLGGVQSIKTIESNASIKGLDTMIIPTSTKNLKFTAEYGDGINDIKNIWSAAAEHSLDGFEGIDLLDIELEYLDMAKLINITNGINFNIAPSTQHPNMNTYRTNNYFKPEGIIDLTNYTSDMNGLLKGVDLSKLDIVINKNKDQDDLTGLFEGAILAESEADKVKEIISKFNVSTNWSEMFKDAEMGFDSDVIEIPGIDSYREMYLSGMYEGTDITKDILITDNVRDISKMFKNCKNMKEYLNNWDTTYTNLVTEECYTGTGGDLELVPVPWGGYGFYDNVTSEIVVRIPKAGYELVLTNKYKTTTSYGIVNWGDGTIDSLNDNKFTHIFESAGVYTIKGHFTFGLGYVSNTSLNSVLIEVKHIAEDTVNLNQAFKFCTMLTKVNLGGLKPEITSEMFNGCTNLTEVILDGMDCSNIIDSNNMFCSCANLTTLNLNELSFDNLVDIHYMFSGCALMTNLGISINTENVTNMSGLFNGCSSLTSLDLSNFNTSNVTSMNYMFNGCSSLTSLDLSNFNTSNVTNVGHMFNNCSSLTGINLNNFNTSNVTNMANMFNGCANLLNIDLSNFNTSIVTDMTNMFNGCKVLSGLSVSSFNTENVTSMDSMFYNCSNLKSLDLSSFNTSNLINMSNMFNTCSGLTTIDLSKFDTGNVTSIEGLFYNCTNLSSVDISSFITDNLVNMKSLFYKCTGLLSVDLSNFNTSNVTDMNSLFYDCVSLTSLDLSNFDTSSVTNMGYMFRGCIGLTSLNVSSFNTENVTSMNYMFYNCSSLKELNIDNFVTTNVTNMTAIFRACEQLTELNVSNFDTSNVTNMGYMFYDCGSLSSLDVSSFNTEKTTVMNDMFNGCEGLTTLSLSNFNTSVVTTMKNMFCDCSKLTSIDISSFNTSKVTTMQSMFSGCTALATLDITRFDTSSVTNMNSMFSNCKNISTLDLSKLSTDKVTDMGSMFTGCSLNVTLTNRTNPKLTKINTMFNVYYGTTINMSGFSIANSTNNENFINVAPNLINLTAPSNISKSIKITASSLTVDSLMSIINNLATVSTTQNLEIGSANLAKLSDEQIAIAVNKNWSLS